MAVFRQPRVTGRVWKPECVGACFKLDRKPFTPANNKALGNTTSQDKRPFRGKKTKGSTCALEAEQD